MGRLISNTRNGVTALKTEYAYNVRSWMKGITEPLFSQSLYYNDKRSSNTNEVRYNGNISGMDWIADSKNRGYDFSYDALSRLKGANYLEGGARSDKFDTSYSYDRQGNVLTLSRRGNAGTTTYNTVDNLTMNYMGNQLIRVEDTATNPSLSMSMDFKNGTSQEVEYSYDRNGNMVKDLNKGISSIEYNVLNLPQKVTFTGANNQVNEYVYSAAGKKLAVIHKSSTDKRTDYVGNMIYENSSLKRILVDGGYIENGIYHFFLQDHLGNNRIVAKADGTVVQTNHYYPYGMSFAKGTQTSNQPYRYNGKEIYLENGLNLYDYEARQAEVATGRFTTIDPLAEKYYSVSTYAYCLNSPIYFIDPTGMSPEDELEKYISKNLREYVNLFFEFLSSLMRMHPAERYSDNRLIQVDANRKTENFINTVNEVNKTVLSVITWAELGYNLITNQEVTGEDAAWEVAGIAPLGKFAKGTKFVNKGETLLNFSKAAASHMDEAGRFVPIQILDDVIKTTKGVPDPKESRALMHTTEMIKNGKSYNLDILHDKKPIVFSILNIHL